MAKECPVQDGTLQLGTAQCSRGILLAQVVTIQVGVTNPTVILRTSDPLSSYERLHLEPRRASKCPILDPLKVLQLTLRSPLTLSVTVGLRDWCFRLHCPSPFSSTSFYPARAVAPIPARFSRSVKKPTGTGRHPPCRSSLPSSPLRPPLQTTSKLDIIIMSSCSRLWQ